MDAREADGDCAAAAESGDSEAMKMTRWVRGAAVLPAAFWVGVAAAVAEVAENSVEFRGHPIHLLAAGPEKGRRIRNAVWYLVPQ